MKLFTSYKFQPPFINGLVWKLVSLFFNVVSLTGKVDVEIWWYEDFWCTFWNWGQKVLKCYTWSLAVSVWNRCLVFTNVFKFIVWRFFMAINLINAGTKLALNFVQNPLQLRRCFGIYLAKVFCNDRNSRIYVFVCPTYRNDRCTI